MYKKRQGPRREYRSISLTSVISRLLEHIICQNLLNHLESNNILTSLNHSFRLGVFFWNSDATHFKWPT